MADIIDKIGKYFAEQEAQLQQVYAQAATQAALPPSTLHRNASFKSHSHQYQQPPPSQQQLGELDNLPGRNSSRERQQPSLLRKRLSLQSSHVSSANASYSPDISHPPPRTPAAVPAVAVKTAPPVIVPPLAFPTAPSFSSPTRATSAWNSEDAWSEVNGDDGFASWRSSARSSHREFKATPVSQIDAKTAWPEVESSDDGDNEHERESQATSNSGRFSLPKPRKSTLKRRGSVKKKRRSTKQTPTEPDPEQMKREKEQKVAAALVLAQERAKRIQMDREQQLRHRELANREEQRRVQDEMEKIEVIRLKSKQFALRLRPNSAPSTPGGAPSSSSGSFSSRSTKSRLEPETALVSNNNTISKRPDCEDNSAVRNPEKGSSGFLDKMERQLRDRMVVELRIRERTLSNQQAQELEFRRVSSQLEKQNTRNEKKQQRLATLEASKQSLEKELAKVQEQLQNSRSQRLEIEETSRRERVQRQRDAERQLRARLQTEERYRMLEDEKVRSEVAADARKRASQRIVSRASSLKKVQHSYNDLKVHHPRRPSRGNNNDDEDEEPSLPRTSRTDTNPKAALLFAPELAEFEEEGLLDNGLSIDLAQQQREAMALALEMVDVQHETEQDQLLIPETNSLRSSDDPNFVESAETKFEWRVPPFEDRALFDRVLMQGMLSDSD